MFYETYPLWSLAISLSSQKGEGERGLLFMRDDLTKDGEKKWALLYIRIMLYLVLQKKCKSLLRGKS